MPDNYLMGRETALKQICQQYAIEILYVFGNRAKDVLDWLGDEDAWLSPGGSDGDIGVKSSNKLAELLRILAGYRNRMVHFYHKISAEGLHEICSTQLSELEHAAEACRHWLVEHPEPMDASL